LQIRLMDVAADAQTLAAALNHSAFNIANALGAWLGGLAISAGFGFAATGWVGALLALAGLMVFAVSLASDRRTARASASGQPRLVAPQKSCAPDCAPDCAASAEC
jgi:DHA1 family inner membrane transport protein